MKTLNFFNYTKYFFCISFPLWGLGGFFLWGLGGCNKPKKIAEKTIEKPLYAFENIDQTSTNNETAIIDTLVNRFLKQWEITGASLAICKDGKLIYAKGFGYADKEKNEKMQANNLLRIASVSKLFTAVGIMRLVEDGDLRLDSKVFGENGILNEYTHLIQDSLVKEITVQHLLTHTGGWRNQLRTDPMFAPVEVARVMKVPSPVSLEQTIAFMLSQKGYFKPGTFVDYSNFGYCVLGKVIEKISKKSYEKYLQENILKPIGITQMRIGKNRYSEKFPKEVRYYDQPNAPKVPSIYDPQKMVERVYEGNNFENLGASGGWIASVIDLVQFACAIDGMDTFPDFLSKETIEKMAFPQKNLYDNKDIKIEVLKENTGQENFGGNDKNIPLDTSKKGISKEKTKNNENDTSKNLYTNPNLLEKPQIAKPNYMVLGWRSVDTEKWWRTGNLSSTSSDLTRRNDGYTFAFVTNTGSWRGPYFPYEVQGLLRKILTQVKFPEKDFFKSPLTPKGGINTTNN